MPLRRFYASVYDKNFFSLIVYLFSWRCLAASTSYFLHAAMNLRPPSVTVSTHISPSNAVAFQSPAMPNPWASLCTKSVHSFFHLVLSALNPQRFRTHDSQTHAAHSDERLRPQKSSRAQRCLNALTSGYLEGMIVRSNLMGSASLLGCASMIRSKTRWCTVRSFVQ